MCTSENRLKRILKCGVKVTDKVCALLGGVIGDDTIDGNVISRPSSAARKIGCHFVVAVDQDLVCSADAIHFEFQVNSPDIDKLAKQKFSNALSPDNCMVCCECV